MAKYSITLLFTMLLTLSTSAFSEGLGGVDVCFVKDGNDCIAEVVKKIAQAKSTIDVQAWQMNSSKVISALVDAKKRGVKVFMLLNQKSVLKNNFYTKLKEKTIDFMVCSKNYSRLENVIFIDGSLVVRGSTIFCQNNKKNSSRDVLFLTTPQIINKYKHQFNEIKKSAETFEVFCNNSAKCKFNKATDATKKAAGNAWEGTKKTADNVWEGAKNLYHKKTSKDE